MKLFTLLFCSILLSACHIQNNAQNTDALKMNEAKAFSKKWIEASSIQRNDLVNINKLYEWLKEKTRGDVEHFLGKPDKVDDIGNYMYALGTGQIDGYVYEKYCVICFNQGIVIRIEITK